MNKRILNVDVNINGLRVVKYQDATQCDKNTHFIGVSFMDNIDLVGYTLQVYYMPPFPSEIPYVDTFDNLAQSMEIPIPNRVLQRNGEVTVEFVLSKAEELITINQNFAFEVVKTINGTTLSAYPEGTIKETIAQQIEKIKALLAQTDVKIKDYNDNALSKTNSFNANVKTKTAEIERKTLEQVEVVKTQGTTSKGEVEQAETAAIDTINTTKTEVINSINTSKKLTIQILNDEKVNQVKAIMDQGDLTKQGIVEEGNKVVKANKTELDTYVNTTSKPHIDNYVTQKEGEIKGATYIPTVDDAGNISWVNDKNLENPMTKNIKGPKGDRGEKGEPGVKGEKGEPGNYSFKIRNKHLIILIG